MQNLELFLEKFNKILWGNWLVFVLLGLGILYSIATGFVQVRHFKFIIHNTLAKSFKERNIEKREGSLSTFQAMMVTLAGNIGGGNVVGVATAIVAGGYGAIFWMCLLHFLEWH